MIDLNNLEEFKKLYEDKLKQYNDKDFEKVDQDWEFWKERIKSPDFNLQDWALIEDKAKGTNYQEHGYCLPNFLEMKLKAYGLTQGLGGCGVRKVYMGSDGIYRTGKGRSNQQLTFLEARKIFDEKIKNIIINLINSNDYQRGCKIIAEVDDSDFPSRFRELLSRILVLLYPTHFVYRVSLPKIYEFEKEYTGKDKNEKNNKLLEFIAYKLGLDPKNLTRQQVWAITQILHELYNQQNPKINNEEREEGKIEEDENTGYMDNQHNFSCPLNQILYGVPGTGKTYNTIIKAMEIINKKQYSKEEKNNYKEIKKDFDVYKGKGQIKFITFHQNYSYEDFVLGYKPRVDNNNMVYKLIKGPFYDISQKAEENKDQNYVLIIDEINRGNISKIFGELITLIEEDKRIGNEHTLTIPLMYKDPEKENNEFGIPNNLYIIGTMNTTDKSIALVDIALRRRFTFIEMKPNADLIKEETLKGFLNEINKKLERDLSKDHQIGHSYFIGKTENDLPFLWEHNIRPLLEEYFYGDNDKIKEYENIYNQYAEDKSN